MFLLRNELRLFRNLFAAVTKFAGLLFGFIEKRDYIAIRCCRGTTVATCKDAHLEQTQEGTSVREIVHIERRMS